MSRFQGLSQPEIRAEIRNMGELNERLLARVRAENRERLNSEETALFDGREEEIREAETYLSRSEPIRPEIPGGQESRAHEPGQVRVLAPEERLAATVTRPEDTEFRGMTIGRYVRGLATGDWTDAEMERRAMSIGSLSGGGHIVPGPLSSELIDMARVQARIFQAGARTIPMDSSTLKIGKLVKDPEAGWRAENTDLPFSDAELSGVTLEAKTLGVIVRASVELWEDAGNLDDILRRSLSNSLAGELDRVGLSGAGSGAEPQGIAGADGVQTITSVGELDSYAPFSQAMEMVENENGEPTALIYSPRDHYILDRLTDSTGQPLRPPPSFEGLRRLRTNQARTNLGTGDDESEAVVGDFRNLLVGMRTNLVIEVSREAAAGTESAFRKLQVWVRAYLRADIAIARPAEFVYLSGITEPVPEA